MYKKYRLIKKYPGSPNLDYIAICDKNNFETQNIDTYPEFWREIKEKEYEILSFMDKNIIFNLSDEVYQSNADIDFACGLKYCLNNFKIHSIRRLSDSEVFSTGDKVFETITGKKDNWIIKEFSTKDDRCFSCGININNIEHYKKPLFITEDGVEVLKEGDFFIVDTDYNQEGACYFAWSIGKLFIKNKSDLPVSSCVKIFSTEKAAKEYIDLNKPRFSKKDLLDASINIQYGGWFIEGLIKRLNK